MLITTYFAAKVVAKAYNERLILFKRFLIVLLLLLSLSLGLFIKLEV